MTDPAASDLATVQAYIDAGGNAREAGVRLGIKEQGMKRRLARARGRAGARSNVELVLRLAAGLRLP